MPWVRVPSTAPKDLAVNMSKDREWLSKRAEQEDRHFVSAGCDDAGLVQQAEPRLRTPQDGVRVSELAPEFEQGISSSEFPDMSEQWQDWSMSDTAKDKGHTSFEQVSRCCK